MTRIEETCTDLMGVNQFICAMLHLSFELTKELLWLLFFFVSFLFYNQQFIPD